MLIFYGIVTFNNKVLHKKVLSFSVGMFPIPSKMGTTVQTLSTAQLLKGARSCYFR